MGEGATYGDSLRQHGIVEISGRRSHQKRDRFLIEPEPKLGPLRSDLGKALVADVPPCTI